MITVKETACEGGRTLAVQVDDHADGSEMPPRLETRTIRFAVLGPAGAERGEFQMPREEAAELGRALVRLFGEDG
jgi:hypothetical protein